MYRDILGTSEKSVISDECDCIFIGGAKKSGILTLTDKQKIIFATKNGSSKFQIDHEYFVDDIDTAKVSVVDKFLGKRLVLLVKLMGVKAPGDNKVLYQDFKKTIPGQWVDVISNAHAKNKQRCYELLIAVLKSHEKTSFNQIYEICKGPFYLEAYSKEGESRDKIDDRIEEILMQTISSDKVEGFIEREKREFVHKIAYQQKSEVVQYQVATSFEFGKNGVISLKCPSCGSPENQHEKTNEAKCRYCGTTFIIPKKILDLI
jgi:DNA-directed RNA polymerase subunit RPC12/RpoP